MANRSIALVDRPQDATLFRRPEGPVTAAAFLSHVADCAARLPQDAPIVNCCRNRYWFAVAFAAAVSRGQVTLLTGDQSASGLAALRARFSGLHAACDDASFSAPLPHVRVDAVRAANAKLARPPSIPAGQLAAIVFTSGTSGEPVGVSKSFGELAARSQAAGIRFGFCPSAPVSVLGTVPPNHMYGFETTVLLPLHAAAASWCGPAFYPADLSDALAALPDRRVLVTTPLQLRGLLLAPPPANPPALVISATAPLDPGLAAAAERLWRTEVMEIFGATEVGSIASRRTVADPVWSAYPGVVLEGEDRPLVSAPNATPRRFSDMIELLDGQRFRLVGRSGDIVKRGGRRASLAELTRVLNGVDGVEDGVFVAPDDLDTRPTARLLAFVVAPTRSREQVLGELRARIAPVFLPRPLLHVDRLPRNALGKLPRDALLALAAAPQQSAYRKAG